jgi:hypothetical protein
MGFARAQPILPPVTTFAVVTRARVWPGRRLFFLLNSSAAVAAQVRGRVAALGLASSRLGSRYSSLSIDSRVRGPRRHERGRSAARPARAAWSALRLLTDVDRCRRFLFRRFRFGANDGARAFGAIDHAAAGRDSFFVISGSGRWRW